MELISHPIPAALGAWNVWRRQVAGGFIFAGVPSVGTSDAATVLRVSMRQNMPRPQGIPSYAALSRVRTGSMITRHRRSAKAQSCLRRIRTLQVSPLPGRGEKCRPTGNRFSTSRGNRFLSTDSSGPIPVDYFFMNGCETRVTVAVASTEPEGDLDGPSRSRSEEL